MIQSNEREAFLARFEMKPRWMLVEHLSHSVGELYRYRVLKGGKLSEPAGTVVLSPYHATILPIGGEIFLIHRRDVVATEINPEGNGDADVPVPKTQRR